MRRIAISVFAFVLFAGAHLASALDTNGLVLYLPFDEGSGEIAKDESGNKNDGKFSGKVSWVAGKFGKAVKVTEDAPANMVVVKNSASLNLGKAASLVAWCNLESMPDSHNSIITKADTWMIHLSNWRGPAFEWEPLFWTPAFVAWQTAASVNIAKSEWHHIVGTWDGKQVLTYIDGVEKGKYAQAGNSIADTPADVVIGRDSRGCCNARKATMSVDDVMVWNRAITAAEVKEIYGGNFLSVDPRAKAATTWAALRAE
ncbi:LamG domain-containing protein [Candidatus Poribacteria bacterium]|nr:LamG domain-containing protein [Candidatus Poribacteria bacterium]